MGIGLRCAGMEPYRSRLDTSVHHGKVMNEKRVHKCIYMLHVGIRWCYLTSAMKNAKKSSSERQAKVIAPQTEVTARKFQQTEGQGVSEVETGQVATKLLSAERRTTATRLYPMVNHTTTGFTWSRRTRFVSWRTSHTVSSTASRAAKVSIRTVT